MLLALGLTREPDLWVTRPGADPFAAYPYRVAGVVAVASPGFAAGAATRNLWPCADRVSWRYEAAYLAGNS